jgi:GxxExxY protein
MKHQTIRELCDIVRQIAYDIHRYLGHGHLEKVYENALKHRLQKAQLYTLTQHPHTVYDEDGTILGEYFSDLWIEDCLIVEIKATRTLTEEHTAQLLGYLKSSGVEHGLLINFGSARFQIRKFILNDTDALPES